MALTGLTPIQITNLNVSGIATFEQEVGVGGTLTYQDVTNVDAIGIITARAGVNVSAGQLDVGNNIKIGNAGVATAVNFKTGVSNLHNVGLTLSGGQIDVGSNIKIGNAGVVTATAFHGDISNATGAAAGLGTALSSTQTSPLNKLYYTNRVLSVGSTITVDHPASATGAYTQYADIQVEDDADLIVADGDDLIPDILGLGGNGTTGAGGAGRLLVDNIVNRSGSGAPTFPNGAVHSGITTFNQGGSEVVRINSGGLLAYNDISFFGASTHAYWDHSANQFKLNDNTKLTLGSSSDYEVYHDGSNAVHRVTGDGDLKLLVEEKNFIVQGTGGHQIIKGIDNGAVELYHNNNKRLETTNAGVECTGNLKFTGSGNGIDFSVGAAGASQSNVLDEYEEGVWTPALTDASSGGGAYVNPPSNMNARYIKIGRLVHLHFGVHAIGGTAAVANFTTSNPIYITGLPFPCLAQHSKHFVSMGYMPTVIEKNVFASLSQYNTWMNFQYHGQNTGTGAGDTVKWNMIHISSGAGYGNIAFDLMYETYP